MTLEFKQEQISKIEDLRREPYAGYFAPNGNLINFNTLLGGSYHDAWQNPVSWSFLDFVSYIIKGSSSEDFKTLGQKIYEREKYLGIDEQVIRGYGMWYDFNGTDMDTFLSSLDKEVERYKKLKFYEDYDKFKYDLLLFFQKAYSNKTFFETIGRNISVESSYDFGEKYEYLEPGSADKERWYRMYLIETLMSHFKDICVQYLGYDSLERVTARTEEIIIPRYEPYTLDFVNTPRVITSSNPNVNERFYNYLLMDWRIDKLPRYFFNEETKKFETHDLFDYYESDNEKILEQEIQAVKRLVPREQRYKYFR